MYFMPKDCDKALSVTASGNHPLFCSLYGAKHVDTFDITPNAKCIMNIKTCALSCLNRDEYVRMLENLWWRDDALSAPHMDKVAKLLSDVEYRYLYLQKGTRLFNQGGWDSKDNKCLPSDLEYEKLQQIVKQPYNFIQTDITELCSHLNQSYDFIHLSNIFDHIDDVDEHWRIIYPLLNHVNVGGRVVSYQLFGYRNQFPEKSIKNADLIQDILKNYKLKRYFVGLVNDDKLNVLERVR
jgi:hypothetical protein